MGTLSEAAQLFGLPLGTQRSPTRPDGSEIGPILSGRKCGRPREQSTKLYNEDKVGSPQRPPVAAPPRASIVDLFPAIPCTGAG